MSLYDLLILTTQLYKCMFQFLNTYPRYLKTHGTVEPDLKARIESGTQYDSKVKPVKTSDQHVINTSDM